MINGNLSNYFFCLFCCSIISSSCQESTRDLSDGMSNVELQKTIDSLQHNLDSLRTQVQLCQDTILEQRIRLNKIKTILEPLIQQEDYE